MRYINNIKGQIDSGRGRLADIKRPPAYIEEASTDRTERAQMLLITALALAVILVTVALLLNAAIFTENVATRDTTADGHEAIELRGEVVQGIGELIERENRQGLDESEIVDNVESGINATGNMTDRERARGGTIATLSYIDSETGELLRYNDNGDSRLFSDAAAENTWTLIDNLGSARAFTVGIEPNELNESTAASSGDVFGIRFSNTSEDDVTLHIYDDEDEEGNLTVARAQDGETPNRLCRIEHGGSSVDIDITGDRLTTDGAIVDCYRGLWPDYEPDSIEFVNIDEEEGTASVTVDEGSGWPTEVTNTDAVYSATVDISYQTTDLSFETTARIAPGEP